MQGRILIFLILVLFSSMAMGQNRTSPQDEYLNSAIQTTPFDKQQWQKAIEGIDYSKAAVDEDIDEDIDEDDEAVDTVDSDEFERKYTPSVSNSNIDFWSSFFKFIFVIMVISIVAYLAYRLIGEGWNRPKDRQFTPSGTIASIEEIEENIHEHDFRYYIQQAIQDNNFALAIRLYYLAILKELSIKKQIRWKRDKTNREYLNEVQGQPISDTFRKATHIFERIWYGNGQLVERDFRQLEPTFQKLVDEAQRIITTKPQDQE